MWSSLSVTFDRSVVFSWSSGFLHQYHWLRRKRIRATLTIFLFFIFHTLISKIHTLICKFYTLICKIYTLICKIYILICKFYTLICKIYNLLICKIHCWTAEVTREWTYAYFIILYVDFLKTLKSSYQVQLKLYL
jgi:hypothetical protein